MAPKTSRNVKSKKGLRSLPVRTVAEKRAASVGGGKSTAKLYETCCKGTHLPEVVIE